MSMDYVPFDQQELVRVAKYRDLEDEFGVKMEWRRYRIKEFETRGERFRRWLNRRPAPEFRRYTVRVQKGSTQVDFGNLVVPPFPEQIRIFCELTTSQWERAQEAIA